MIVFASSATRSEPTSRFDIDRRRRSHGTGNAQDNVLTGNSGNNVLDADGGTDTLIGGAGNDTLKGGTGNDTYVIHCGDGLDKISENDATPGNADTLLYGGGINPLDLVLSRQANDYG